MKVNHLVILFLMISLTACVPTTNTSRSNTNSSDTTDISKRHQLSLIEVSENQMTINGSNLSTINSVKSKYGPQIINFNILSKSDSTVHLSVPNGMKLISGFIYDLIITDAFGQSTTSISFDVQNDSISTSKIQDGAITNSKLSSLGASSAGQVLQYDGVNWVAVNYTGGSNYLGRIEVDPGAGITQPPTSGLNNGDFYVVNDASPVTGDLNGDGNIETYTAGDLIRFNSVTGKWDLQSSSGSYVGPWSISGTDILRTGTGKTTISESPLAGPAKLNIGSAGMAPTSSEESILLNIGGNVPYAVASDWSRAMSFGLRQEQNATIGVYGDHTNNDQARYFYIDVDRDGNLEADFWNDADFYISMEGNVGIGSPPSNSYTFETFGNGRFSTNLDVDGTVDAALFVGDGSGLFNVNATNMTNDGTMTIRSGGTGSGDIAFQSESSEFAIYDGAGNLSLGHGVNTGSFTSQAQLDVRGNGRDAEAQFLSYGPGNQSTISLGSSRGSVSSSGTTITNDVLGVLNFSGDSGSGIVNSAEISVSATEDYTTGSGAQISFSTTANTTTSLQENMVLTNDGRLLVGNAATGDTTANTLVVGGSSQISNNLDVNGTTNLSNTVVDGNYTQTGGNFNLTGDLDVDGVATVNSLIADSITNNGLLDNIGNVDIDGTLSVENGLSSFNAGAAVTGGLTTDTLTVSTTTSFGELTATGKVISEGAGDHVVFKGGTDNNFEIYVEDATGIHLGNVNTGGSVTNNLPLSFYTSDTERLRIADTGNIGVSKVPSATYRIDVDGSVNSDQLCMAGVCRTTWPNSLSMVVDNSTIEEDTFGRLQVKDLGITDAKIQTVNASKLIGVMDWTNIDKTGSLPSDIGLTGITGVDAALTTSVSLLPTSNAVKTYVDSNHRWNLSASDLNYTAGSVGIGTTTPSDAFHVNEGNIRVTSSTSSRLILEEAGTTEWAMLVDSGNIGFQKDGVGDFGTFGLLLKSNEDVVMHNNVGIGVFSPSEKLHVQGNLRVEGTTDCTLGTGAGATNCTSDERLKDNVTNIDNALDKIKALNGVEFDWNEKSISPGTHSIGVIAQDVQEQFPTAVIENSEGWLAVDYAVLVSPLIEAVKELDQNLEMYKTMSEGVEAKVSANSREIASLKTENQELKSQVESLESENKEMKQALCSLNNSFKFCQ